MTVTVTVRLGLGSHWESAIPSDNTGVRRPMYGSTSDWAQADPPRTRVTVADSRADPGGAGEPLERADSSGEQDHDPSRRPLTSEICAPRSTYCMNFKFLELLCHCHGDRPRAPGGRQQNTHEFLRFTLETVQVHDRSTKCADADLSCADADLSRLVRCRSSLSFWYKYRRAALPLRRTTVTCQNFNIADSED